MAVKIDKDLYLKNIKEIYNIPGSIKTVEHYLTELVDGYNNLVDEEANSEFILVEKTLTYGADSITWTETERDNLMENICILKLNVPKDSSENPAYDVYYLFCVGRGVELAKYSVVDGLNEEGIHQTAVYISSSSLSSEIYSIAASFGEDAPIHFIKLTSTTLTEALRTEILSDDYFVILEYDNKYYYERNKGTNFKAFEEPIITVYNSGTHDITITNNILSVWDNTLSVTLTTFDKDVPVNQILNTNISSKVGNNFVTAGKVLTADGYGNTSWETPSNESFTHHIILRVSDTSSSGKPSYDVEILVKNNSSTPFTKESFMQWLYDNGHIDATSQYEKSVQRISWYTVNNQSYQDIIITKNVVCWSTTGSDLVLRTKGKTNNVIDCYNPTPTSSYHFSFSTWPYNVSSVTLSEDIVV